MLQRESTRWSIKNTFYGRPVANCVIDLLDHVRVARLQLEVRRYPLACPQMAIASRKPWHFQPVCC